MRGSGDAVCFKGRVLVESRCYAAFLLLRETWSTNSSGQEGQPRQSHVDHFADEDMCLNSSTTW